MEVRILPGLFMKLEFKNPELAQLVSEKWLRSKAAEKPSPETHAAMFAKRKEGGPIHLTHDSMLLSHAFYALGKTMELARAHVVDVGCGDGSLARNLRNNMRFTPLLGLDVRGGIWRTDPKSDFLKCNFLDDWPLKLASVETAVVAEVLEHFKKADSAKLAKNICASLKKGGHFIITLPVTAPVHDDEKDWKTFGHLHYWDVLQFQELILSFGMVTKELFASRMVGDPAPVQDIKATIVHEFGKDALKLFDITFARYGQRITRSLFAHVLDPYSARHINAVFRKL